MYAPLKISGPRPLTNASGSYDENEMVKYANMWMRKKERAFLRIDFVTVTKWNHEQH